MKACYYCLSVDIEPEERTGDGRDICPNCAVDSVVDYESEEKLYELHSTNFHMVYRLIHDDSGKRIIDQIPVSIPCGHPKCKLYDKLLLENQDLMDRLAEKEEE